MHVGAQLRNIISIANASVCPHGCELSMCPPISVQWRSQGGRGGGVGGRGGGWWEGGKGGHGSSQCVRAFLATKATILTRLSSLKTVPPAPPPPPGPLGNPALYQPPPPPKKKTQILATPLYVCSVYIACCIQPTTTTGACTNVTMFRRSLYKCHTVSSLVIKRA